MKPKVTTHPITNITQFSASGGGQTTGTKITERGVCYGVSQYASTITTHTHDGTGAGVFTSVLDNLSPNTKYYVRAYATNNKGTGYGSQVTFITGNTTTTSTTKKPVTTTTTTTNKPVTTTTSTTKNIYETNLRNNKLSSAEIDEKLRQFAERNITLKTIDIRGNSPRTKASDVYVFKLVKTLNNILLENY